MIVHHSIGMAGLFILLGLSVLQHASANNDSTPRDPFWPVGYEIPVLSDTGKSGVSQVTTQRAWPTLPVKGISRGADATYFALVEGHGVVRAGDDISIEKEGLWFHWRVINVDARGLRSMKLGITKTPGLPPARVPDQKNDATSIQEINP